MTTNPVARVLLQAGSEILISILGLGVLCNLTCVVSGGGPDIVLTTNSGRPVFAYLSSILAQSYSSYGNLTYGHFGFKPLAMLYIGEDKQQRKKSYCDY